METTLGIDIGRVIIHGDGPDTSFVGGSEDDALRTPPLEGSFESIGRLVRLFRGRVWLVSKCGQRVANRSRRWLDHHRFWETTGVPRDQLRFCRERKEKAGICRELGIGWFVDDRLDVLVPMAGIVPHRFLFGASWSTDSTVHPVPSWTAAESLIQAIRDDSAERAS